MRRFVLVLVLAACGSSAGSRTTADAGGSGDAPPDALGYPACHEFGGAGMTVPAHAGGTLDGADVTCPAQCATVDAPYGVETSGPDSVVRLENLVPGTAYVVHVASDSDLSFYVVTGCSTPSGPSASECVLFEDASTGDDEVGTFVATAPSMYVVVDYYASHPPSDSDFTIDVYAQTCTTSSQCSGATPVCSNGECVQCASDFDCADPAESRCDTTTDSCAAGVDACTSDDSGEPGNDGPAGATVLALDYSGAASWTGQICSDPSFEADYIAFDVTTVGDTWDVMLSWSGTRDLDLELYDAHGTAVGLSYWEHPEHARLTYLAPGRYYAKVTEFSSVPDPAPVTYTLSAQRTAGAGCTSRADCAVDYRNQIYRGDCEAGACIAIDGAGAVPQGGACDSMSDCAPSLSCPSFYFVANANTRDVCAPGCTTDGDCGALGTDDVCTTYLQDNFCVQKCTADSQCPTSLGTQPQIPPWYRLSCDLPSGHCLP